MVPRVIYFLSPTARAESCPGGRAYVGATLRVDLNRTPYSYRTGHTGPGVGVDTRRDATQHTRHRVGGNGTVSRVDRVRRLPPLDRMPAYARPTQTKQRTIDTLCHWTLSHTTNPHRKAQALKTRRRRAHRLGRCMVQHHRGGSSSRERRTVRPPRAGRYTPSIICMVARRLQCDARFSSRATLDDSVYLGASPELCTCETRSQRRLE